MKRHRLKRITPYIRDFCYYSCHMHGENDLCKSKSNSWSLGDHISTNPRTCNPCDCPLGGELRDIAMAMEVDPKWACDLIREDKDVLDAILTGENPEEILLEGHELFVAYYRYE